MSGYPGSPAPPCFCPDKMMNAHKSGNTGADEADRPALLRVSRATVYRVLI
ncbi:MAG: hypothetical protein ACLQOO_19165 [Terriglobia bacterium]